MVTHTMALTLSSEYVPSFPDITHAQNSTTYRIDIYRDQHDFYHSINVPSYLIFTYACRTLCPLYQHGHYYSIDVYIDSRTITFIYNEGRSKISV